MTQAVFADTELNCYRALKILSCVVLPALRELFKQEWDRCNKTSLGEWNDTPKNGKDFEDKESERNRRHYARLLTTIKCGNRAEWDPSMLFYAILESKCINVPDPVIRANVIKLREFRNKLFHMKEGQLSDLDFKDAVKNVDDAFQALKLSTQDIQTISNQSSFKTDEVQKLTQDLQKSEEQREALEIQLENKAKSFCFLPARPSHPIAPRDCEVSKVKHKLSNLKKDNASRLSSCYISGNPGSGKSQLASLVADTFHKEAIKDTSALSFVMTLSAESSEALKTSYESLARNVGCDSSSVTAIFESKHLSTETKINSLKALIAAEIHLYASWLLIVDNVTSLDCTHKFLPESGNQQWGKGQLIITTQDSLHVPTDSPFTSHISISEGMKPIDTRKYLAMVSNITDKDLEDEVAKALDYQPLALASAGIYVKEVRKRNPTFGWKDYLEKLEQGQRAGTENELKRTNLSYPYSMTVATKIAVERVMNSEEVMKHAFTFLALCAPDRLRLDILTNYILNEDEEQDKEDIGNQIQGSSLLLVEKEQDCVYVRLHQVVHDTAKLVVKTSMETATEVQAALVAAKSFHQFITETIPEEWIKVGFAAEGRLLAPHLKTLAVEIGNIFSTEEKYQFLKSTIADLSLCIDHFTTLGIICNQHGELASAKEYFSEAVKLQEGSEATDNPTPYHNLGVLEDDMGNYQLAKGHYERALSIKKNKFGLDHIEVATTYYNLGILQKHLGNYQLAKDYSTRALSIRKKKLDPEHIDVASSYHSLGSLQIEMGNYQLAKEYYELALSIRKKKLGPKHVEVAFSYHGLGNIQSEMDNFELAKEHYERALSIRKKMLGPEHIAVADTIYRLGVLQYYMGNHQLAKEDYELALSIRKKKLGPKHVHVARIYHSLGVLQNDMGNCELAKQHLEHALSITEKKLGPKHVDVANIYHSLGTLQNDIGNHELAKEHLQLALSTEVEILGPEHLKVAKTCNDLGASLTALSNFQLAKEHYERALSIQKKKLSPEHLDVACTHNNLGFVLNELGDEQLAMEHYEHALSIRKKKLGPKHLQVARTHSDLGILLRYMGNHQLAKKHYEHALSIQKKQLGPVHLDIARTYHNLGLVLWDMGNHQLAREHFEHALSIRKEKLGTEHVDVAFTCHFLGDLEHCLGNNQLAKEHLELALSIRTKKLGHDDVNTKITSKKLCDVQRALESAPSVQLLKRKPDDVDSGCTDHKKRRCDDSP